MDTPSIEVKTDSGVYRVVRTSTEERIYAPDGMLCYQGNPGESLIHLAMALARECR